MDFKSLVNTIETLPPLSESAVLIQRLYAEGAHNVNVVRLIKIIESDVLLSANVLKMINAPAYGFYRQITSVSQAVTLFGTQTIYALVIRYAMHEKLVANLRAYNISNDLFNDICHLQSALLTQWYSKTDIKRAQFLAPLALLMEIGKLILAKVVTQEGKIKEFKEGLAFCTDIVTYEDSVCGTSSYYLSALLFDHWDMEPLYVQMLKGLDYERDYSEKLQEYIEILDVIRTAINVKEILSVESIQKASHLVSLMGLDEHYFESVAKRIKQTYLQNSDKR
ncbi:MAG: HDOD domain-containing protein [Sulfurimonas sp.]|nr:HDOD domain-containing protein [Sulfurimonas sp.]MDD3060387.1 HDOD domain-containing protein [Sulfurimonas sp.]MDD5203699.1 HDOD domain-containing protein [Sulfurimonas sp.]